jgi:hypothetical protein
MLLIGWSAPCRSRSGAFHLQQVIKGGHKCNQKKLELKIIMQLAATTKAKLGCTVSKSSRARLAGCPTFVNDAQIS